MVAENPVYSKSLPDMNSTSIFLEEMAITFSSQLLPASCDFGPLSGPDSFAINFGLPSVHTLYIEMESLSKCSLNYEG